MENDKGRPQVSLPDFILNAILTLNMAGFYVRKRSLRRKKLDYLLKTASGVPVLGLQEVHVRRRELLEFEKLARRHGFCAFVNPASESKKRGAAFGSI